MDQTRASSRFSTPNLVIFLVIFYLVSNSGSGDNGILPEEIDQKLAYDKFNLAYLNNATYSTRFNIQNKTLPIQSAHLEQIPQLKRAYDSHESLPFFLNASSSLRGSWQAESQNSTKESFFSAGGTVRASVDDRANAIPASRAKISFTFTSKRGWSTKDIDLEGIHHHESGLIYLASHTQDAHGVFYAPMLANASTYNLTRQGAAEVLQTRIDEARPHEEKDPVCQYFAACQLHKTTGSAEALRVSEQEYALHTGESHASLPPVQASCFLFSEDCRVAVHLEVEGLRNVQLARIAHSHAVFFIMVVMVQILLTMKQMNQTRSPSQLWRISLWSIGLHCLLDGYFGAAYFMVGLVAPAVYIPLMAAAFLSLLLMTLYGLRYLLLIYRMHRQLSDASSPGVPAPATEPALEPATEPALEAAATEPETTPAEVETPLTDAQIERRDLTSLYVRFYFALLILLVVTLQIAFLPESFRDISLVTGLILLNSYWVPQIFRHFERGHRKSLSFTYISGISACRMAIVLYLFCFQDNVFFQEVNIFAALTIGGWVWLQIMLLAGQALFGPRFMVPASWSRNLPAVYDYHSLPTEDEESLLTHDGDAGDEATCAICMATLELPHRKHAREAGQDGGVQGAFGLAAGRWRRGVMRTPCHHFYHTECLETWMQRRLKCPVCRAVLPPI